MIKRILIVLALAFVVGCSGGKVTQENFQRVELDMSEAQVEEILGKPQSVMKQPQMPTLYNWKYSDTAWVSFDTGKVFSVTWNDEQIKDRPVVDDPE